MDPVDACIHLEERAEGDIAIGIMSGTSMDSIDAAVIQINGGRCVFLGSCEYEMPGAVREQLLAIVDARHATLGAITRLHFSLSRSFAAAAVEAAAAAGVPLSSVRVIGCHGQTVCHLPSRAEATAVRLPGDSAAVVSPDKGGRDDSTVVRDGVLGHGLFAAGEFDSREDGDHFLGTLQLGSGPVIAALAGVDTVCDFRAADVAAGGTGAPLMPFADLLLQRSAAAGAAAGTRTAAGTAAEVCHNIGGISNVTVPPTALSGSTRIVAFDTGPGNMVIDQIAAAFPVAPRGCAPEKGEGSGPDPSRCDVGGARARRGQVMPGLLAWCLSHPFLALTPPRAAGHEQFGRHFVTEFIARGTEEMEAARGEAGEDARGASALADDLLATATEFTAASIASAYDSFVLPTMGAPECVRVKLSGGGARNTFLVERIRALGPRAVEWHADRAEDPSSRCDHDVPADAREAVGFAIHALAHLHRVPSNIPSVTGAVAPVVLGSLSPAPNIGGGAYVAKHE